MEELFLFSLVLLLLCCKTGEFVLSRTKKSESWCWIQCIKNVYLGISFAVISLLKIEICSKWELSCIGFTDKTLLTSCYYSSFADHLKYILHVNIPCAILLLLFLYVKLKITMNPLSSKVHFLLQTRQTKRRTNRTGRTENQPFSSPEPTILWPFSSPEPTILLACGRNRELRRAPDRRDSPDPIFWVCAEHSFRILDQSDLMGSPWIADFRC